MKFGMRMPSMKKRVSANLSVPRVWSHSVGVKAPRGMGMATDSKKYVYNGIYRNTSFSVDRPIGGKKLSFMLIGVGMFSWFFQLIVLAFKLAKFAILGFIGLYIVLNVIVLL